MTDWTPETENYGDEGREGRIAQILALPPVDSAQPDVERAVLRLRESVTHGQVEGRGGEYFGRSLRGWLKNADAESKMPVFGFGNLQLKSWARWGVGVSAITTALVVAVSVKYIPIKSPADEFKTYTTTRGQRANITLSDGSNVILAPSTTIGVNGRTVDLTGEAIFTVSPNTNSPFIVKAGNSTTRVLGTTFGIRAYQGDKSVRVAVAVGRVAVASTVLSAGDVATLQNDSSEPLVSSGADLSSAFAWTSGRLAFDRTPFPQALQELERWYNVQFQLGDSSLNDRYITTSLGTQSLDEVVRILSIILSARVERSGPTITFYAR